MHPMRRSFVGVLGAGLLAALAAVPVWAHHTFIVDFDQHRPVTLKGTVTRLEWVNPHGLIYLAVEGQNGAETWVIETGSPFHMMNRGLERGDLAFGTVIGVEGFLARNGGRFVAGTTVTLPKGRSYSLGR